MKRRGLVISIIVLVVLIGGILGFVLYRPDPVKLVQEGIDKLSKASSFRYTLTQQQWVEGQERKLTQINGEKSGARVRVWGTLVGTDVEMIRTENAFYTRDPFTKHWIRFPSSSPYQEVFLAELDPLSSLQFKELGEVVLTGQEKVDGKRAWVVQLKPSVNNPIMELSWTDFTYTLYITRKDKEIVKAEIVALSKDKREPVQMSLGFRDYGEQIQIEEP